MNTMAPLGRLDPRERKLIFALAGAVGVVVFLFGPLWLAKTKWDIQDRNEEVRDLMAQIVEARPRLAIRRAETDALLLRYAKPLPSLSGIIEAAAKDQGLTVSEAQPRPDIPQGKKYVEKATSVKLHRVGLAPLVKMLETLEKSTYPLSVSRLKIRPRAGEANSYEVELTVSGFEKKPEAEKDKAAE